MLIDCPHCHAQINGKVPKPGAYTPKCPKCGESFRLTVPDDPDQTVMVSKLPVKPKLEATAVVADPNATGAFAGGGHDGTAPEVAGAFQPEQSPEVTAEVTGAYQPGVGGNEATEATGGYIPKADIDATDPHASGAAADLDATTDPAAAKAVAPKKAKKQAIPEELDGYELVKQLGAGGMGAVYLARQTSLDRSVALKVMHAQWASDPVFLARFTREAYAAAQLNHHNVVQIYDFGEDAGINFFSMEFVDGQSLGDLLKKHGKLEPAAAVGHVLQAARGLKFAHDRGMVHRDIKPDNLMLNAEGLVKVADLGLVKTKAMTAADDQSPAAGPASGSRPGGSKLQQSADVTTVGSAMGSPSYMSPEQCRDATTVDGRADVYSLGCTLYALLSGRTPFLGKTAVEVIRKHLSEPPPPLATVAPDVPAELAGIVGRTLEKEPGARYQTMDDLIAALTAWQGKQASGPPRPTPEQVTVFEALVGQLAGLAPAKLGKTLGLVVPPALGVVGLGLAAVKPALGGAVLLAAVGCVPAGFVTAGLVGDSYLFRRARAWAFGWRAVDWLTAVAAAGLFVAALYFSGLLLPGLFGLVAGGLLGAGWGFLFARPAAVKRDEMKGEFEKILKRQRVAGVDEVAIREFAVNAGGSDWPAAYELLFGYEAMAARRQADPTARLTMRDKLVAKFDALIDARQERRARKRLQALERKKLEAEGVSATEAKARAAEEADELVEQAAAIKASVRDASRAADVKRMRTRRGPVERRPRRSPVAVLTKTVSRTLLDPRLRVLAGALLIVGGLMWASQNRAALAAAEATAVNAGSVQTAAQAKDQAVGFFKLLGSAKTKPLELGFLPGPVAGLFDSLNPVAAGVVLLASALTASGLAVLIALLAASLSLLGHKFGVVPAAGPLSPANLTLVAGLVVGLGAVLVLRRRR